MPNGETQARGEKFRRGSCLRLTHLSDPCYHSPNSAEVTDLTMRRRLLAVLLFIALLSAAACDRLEPASPDPGLDFSDPDVGGGVGVDNGPETPIPTATPTNESSPRLDATAEALATFPPASPTLAATAAPPTAAPLPTETPAPVETPLPPAAEATAEPAPSTTPESAGEIIHIVQPGENLYRIGLQYGLSWAAIAEYNGITNADAISAGQELRIPPTPTPTAEARSDAPVVAEQAPAAGPSATASEGAAEASAALVAADSPAVEDIHTVSPGDTLYSIARRYGISVELVAEANGLSALNQIVSGQMLKIPIDRPGPSHPFAHQVRQGETLASIARQYGRALDELAEVNGLSAPFVIYPGQTVTIPGG